GGGWARITACAANISIRISTSSSSATIAASTGAAHHEPASYWNVIGRANPRKGDVVLRRTPRRRKTATGPRQDGSDAARTEGQNQASNAVLKLDMEEPGTTQ